ncbi:flagellar hook-associated protein FlgL [Massilia sp. RP-1-19]|uniref:Flagellar hook-associated protein FlgL n=1 Tax=Massilia polaris TaxID=2728846 RepID=A0A848HPW8_9BURK|nr:flagellar hook-associated protein FlgL [Massilia polaris]NML63164.1 flagellar hook-associated protein FlgL [Massilia polaris]
MRISTSTMFETGTGQLGTLQSQLARTQMQLSTNRRILTPSDDPVASARALEVTQSQSVNTQYATNRQNARSSLAQVEQALASTTRLIQDVKTLTVNAGNGTLLPADRQALAIELKGRLNDLLGVANTADGVGGYLFSGYSTGSPPFSLVAGGAQYHGDQGIRKLQVASSRNLAISDSGSSVFENVATGNGTFQTSAAAGNIGAGVISSGTIADAAALLGHDYKIEFTVAGTPPQTTYTVTDESRAAEIPLPPPVALNVPFESGKQITFEGVVFDIAGAPANGDVFNVKPSEKQSIFTTLSQLIDTLGLPANGSKQAALSNGLNMAHDNLDAALENVLAVRAGVGSSLKELDYLDGAGEDRNIQYTATLSDLQDLDMVKTISLFHQQKMTLEASQMSFKSLSGLSLFNYIG